MDTVQEEEVSKSYSKRDARIHRKLQEANKREEEKQCREKFIPDEEEAEAIKEDARKLIIELRNQLWKEARGKKYD